ncbi:hypothetical protein ACHAWF_012940, partial [Thalassiosira exigua]
LWCLLLLPRPSEAFPSPETAADDRQRSLALGDFADLNEILRGAVLRLPDAEFSRDGANLKLSEVRCRDLSVGDLALNPRRSSATSVELDLKVVDLNMNCQARYSFSAWWLFGGGGSGTADIRSSGNDATLAGRIQSPNLEKVPPEDIEVVKCNPSVYIDEVQFSNGGIFGAILNIFRGIVADFIESQARGVVCAELRDLVGDAEGLLRFAKEVLDEYKPNGVVWDPLSSEENLSSLQLGGGATSTDRADLLNFRDDGTKFAGWLESSVNQAVRYLSSEAEDPATGAVDMRANALLRRKVLDDDGALEIDSTDLSSAGRGAVFYEGHNRIAKTAIRFDRARMVGLDSLTSFQPLDGIGDYTFRNRLAWDYLGFRLHATIEMTPSTAPDSIVEAPGSARIEEEVELFLGFDDVSAELSTISLFDRDLLRGVTLGSLLDRDDVLPCLLSTVVYAGVTSFSVDVADVRTPTMTGFVSPGTDRIFSSGMEAGFLAYEEIMLDAAHRYFQEEVRPILDERFVKSYVGDSACDPPDWSGSASDLVDFRELLLTPAEALDAGASGLEPYGNVLSSFAMPYLKENVLRGEKFNADYLGPFTESQSGTEGSLVYADTLFQYNNTAPSPLYDSLVLKVSDLRIHHIKMAAGPMDDVLHPVDWNKLSSSIGLDDAPNVFEHNGLTMEIQITVEIGGNDSPLRMQNTLDLTLSIPSSALSFEILANLKESAVINFSVFDVTNYQCWLASLDDSLAKSLVLSELSLDVESFQFDSACVSCSSPGIGYLSEILHDLDIMGFNDIFQDDVVAMLVHMVMDYANSIDIHGLIHASHQHCPHHPSYDTEADADFPWPGLPELRNESVEAMIAIGTIAIQSTIIGTAKNHLLLEDDDGSDQNRTIQTDFPEGSRIVNWTTLDEDLGDWARIAFEEVRDYLGGTLKDVQNITLTTDMPAENLQVNQLLREYVLDNDGVYVLEIDGIGFDASDLELTLTKAKVVGLDSIVAFDPLISVSSSPQTLKSVVQFEALSVTFEVDVLSAGEAKTMTVSYEFTDVIAEVAIDVALDVNRLQDIHLGSIFDTRHIFPCAVSGVRILESSALDFRFQGVGNPVIDGYFSLTHQDVQNISDKLFDTYRADLINGLPLVFNSTLREIMNALSPAILDAASRQCGPPTSYANSTDIIDFRDLLLSETMASSLGGRGDSPYSDIFRTIYDLMQRKVLQSDASNRPLINEMLRKFTNGSISFQEGNSFDKGGRIQMAGLDANFRVVVSNVAISGLNSVGDPLDIFRPTQEANVLNNTVSFGVGSKPLQLSGKLLLTFDDDADIQMRNELAFQGSLENVVLVASVILKLVEGDLASFPLRDLNNIHCWLSMVLSEKELSSRQSIGLVDYSVSLGGWSLDLNCLSCTSPRFVELLSSLYNFSNPDVIESMQNEFVDLLDSDLIKALLDHVVDSSASKCPHRSEFDPQSQEKQFLTSTAETLVLLQEESAKKPIYFTVTNSMIAGFIFILGILFRWTVDLRNKKWIESLSQEGHLHLELQREKEEKMLDSINKMTTSLFKSDAIPKRVRYGVPAVLALNLALLLVAHLGVLYVVDIEASLAGEEFTVSNFFEYTFIESTTQSFKNGGAELVILVWIFAVIWPYIKIFLSLAMWLVPPQRCSIENRGRVLLWIDAAAKLSVIDIFTVIVAIALLLVFIGGHDESYVSEDMLYSLKGKTIPGAGFYCMVIAQRISRTSSKVFCEYHEQVIVRAAKEYENRAKTEISETCDEAIECGVSSIQVDGDVHVEEATKNDARWGIIGVYFGAVTVLIVFIIGAIFAPSISLDASSAAALVIESDLTVEEVVQNYGVFLVASGVLLKARFVFDDTSNYIGFGLLLFAAIASICGVFIVRIYKYIKRRMKEKRSAHSPTPSLPVYTRLTRWRYIEIYVISLAVGIWQLGAICSYCIHVYCEILNRMFSTMAFIGLAEEMPAQCYDIQASSSDNLGIIMGSFFVLLVSFILQAYSQYKKNISESLRWIDNDDVHHLSQVWSKPKNRRYSFIASTNTASISWDSTRDSKSSSKETRSDQRAQIFHLAFPLHNLWESR